MQKFFKTGLIILVILSGCKSRQTAVKTPLTTAQNEVHTAEYVVDQIVKSQSDLSFINISRAETNIDFKGRSFYFVSSVKIVKNQEISISATVLGMEIAKIQLLPTSCYIFDKLHRQYSQISYEELSQMLGTEISYQILENLLTNRLFTFSETAPNKAFSIVQLPEKYILTEKKKAGNFTHFFDVLPDFKISTTSLNDDANEILSVNYSGFDIKNGVLFPMNISLKTNFKDKILFANFDIKKIEINKKFEISPIDISRYKKVNFSSIIP